MSEAKSGDTVKLEYTGKYEDGTVFDCSADHGKPLEFVLGQKQMIPAFEKAVYGMKVNETKNLVVNPDEGYGAHRQELIVTLNRKDLPPDMELKVNEFLEWQQPDGQTGLAQILAVTDEEVKVDTNHPLAGKKLLFEIKLLAIENNE
ncbi:MAG: peptidylprolyl isomerase [Deltaproteobacteria bacterium]|nr:peptidylprolyl isomerase [Deltaproteobacteria bacterium]